MSTYNRERFKSATMSERIIFLAPSEDGTLVEVKKVWAHVIRDSFTRRKEFIENFGVFWKVMVRESKELDILLDTCSHVKWKSSVFSIENWHDPSIENQGFKEIICKSMVSGGTDEVGNFFKDYVDVFHLHKKEVNDFGMVHFEYSYDFSKPDIIKAKCQFPDKKNGFVDSKKVDVEKETYAVLFPSETTLETDDIILSDLYGRFKVEMLSARREGMIEAVCRKSEVQ